MHHIKPWHWGASLITLAMLSLLYLGWTGLKGQRALVWQDARIDATRWSQLIADELPTSIQQHQCTIPLYPSPPTPGTIDFSPKADHATLIRWQREGGTTTAGLPVRVLASLALVQQTPNEAKAEKLATLVKFTEPSVITPNVLGVLEELRKNHHWKLVPFSPDPLWQRDELARNISRNTNPDGWIIDGKNLWWIQSQANDSLSYINPEDLKKILNTLTRDKFQLPAWADAQLELPATNHPPSSPQTTLATTALSGFPDSLKLTLSIIVTDPDLLEHRWKQSRQWNVMMMTLASLGLIGGISVIGVGAAREKKRSQQQNNFIASVTHELRAPVGSIRLMAESLEAGKVKGEKVSEFHRLMAREGARLSTLIENVLDLARIEAGKPTAHHPKEIDLLDVVTTASDSLNIHAEEKQVTLKLSGTSMQVQIDRLSFQQALINLIDNAIKFSPSHSEVIIDWGESPTHWWLTVTDTGPGIPAGKEQLIFKRFFRAGDEMKRETQGAGIGLNLVQHIIDSHNGTIKVQNQQPTGAQFRITLPKSTNQPPHENISCR